MFRISEIETYFPEKKVTNEDLQKEFPEWSPEKIFNKVGVKQRYTASAEETVLELAVKASEKLLKKIDKKISDISYKGDTSKLRHFKKKIQKV